MLECSGSSEGKRISRKDRLGGAEFRGEGAAKNKW